MKCFLVKCELRVRMKLSFLNGIRLGFQRFPFVEDSVWESESFFGNISNGLSSFGILLK